MAGCGLNHDQIALITCGGIGRKTLERYFPDELAIGKADTVHKIARSLIKDAIDGDKASQIFFLKTQAGWRERGTFEVSGPNGGPIPFSAVKWSVVDPPAPK